MDDRFMHELKAAPDPGFGRRLRERLRTMESEAEERDARGFRWAPLLAPALLVALLASVILFPSVRASAQAFLDLFRVRNFTAVSVNPDRLRQLDGKLDLKTMVGDRVETVKEPGTPQVVDSPMAAGVAAGIDVKVPGTLPKGLRAGEVSWRGPGEARVTADAARLRSVLETLEIRDVVIPPGIDGQIIDIKVPPVVAQRFETDKLQVQLLQARSPEVALPAGVDLAGLGEIGLRILGLQPAEARRLAQSIDWRSTLMIPVPADAGSFRQVDVAGASGLMVTSSGKRKDGKPREGSVVLWSRGDMVFALMGNLDGVDLLQMANSVQ